MDRFVSHFTNRLDAKGRVSIPAAFRQVLAKDGFEGLLCYPSLDAETIDCGGHALRQEIDGLLASYPSFSEEHHLFSTALNGASEVLKVDPEGRVILTETLKAFAGVTTEVTFVGQGHKFQIWEPDRFRAHLAEARRRVRDLRMQIGTRQTGGVSASQPHGARE